MRFQNSIRIVDVDFYMASPLNGLDVMYSDFRGIFINQVPVIRVFGSTETGEKICTHVHGVFPYIYIPYSGENDINAQIYKIAIHIDKALNISMNQASSNNQHVYKISLVSAYPFYGYHAKQHQFLKIYLYNPSLIRKLSGLLQTDAILGKVYQPHECHLSFVLQFMIDYNLHGMSTMQVSDMKIRRPAGLVIEEENDLYLPDNINRISTCELEADVLATNIINRLEIATGNLAVNPGIKALWEDEKQRRRNKNEESQIESCLTLKNMEAKPTNSQIVYKRLLLDRLAALSTDNADVKSKCLDTSVYPAETPSSLSVQNASFIENHSQSSNNSFSLDSSSLDTTLTPSNDLEMNNTLDGNFLDILEDLNENPENSLQEDSILSQVVDENQEEDSMDLNWPMQPATPIKISVDEKEANESDDDMWNETLDTTLIPQLDGNDDVLDTSNENVKLEVLPKTFKINFSNSSIEEDPVGGSNKLATQSQPITKLGRDMPLLGNEQGIKNNVTAFAKFKTKVHLKSKLRLILSKCIKRNLDKKTIKIPLTRICVKKRKYIVKKSAKQILQVSEKQKEEVKIINALDNGVKPKFIIKSKFIFQEHTMVTRNKLKKATDKNATKTYKIFLDGNCDSSSSEEETITLKKRKLSQNSDSPRYSTLPVLISSSEKGATRESPFSKENNKTEPKLIKQIHSKESLLFDRVKRQLNFCDTTLVEEQILCNLKSSHIDVNNQTNFETIIESSEFGSLETTSQIIESSESPLESSSSSENESPLNKSYFERNLKLLSKSEKYDAEAHFVPVEGSSKISSDCLQKSFNYSQKNVISSSKESSELCQPGQKEITNTLRNITSQSSEEDPFEAPDHNEMNNITIRILSQVSENNLFPSNHSSEENKQSIESLNSELLLVDRILKPKRNAPTKSGVLLSLDFYKLPHVINPPPFFSNVEDVTGGIEVGLSLLKVLSKTTLHLPEFETTLDTFNTIRKMYMNSVAKNIKINRSNINQIILSCSKTREVILAPVRRPPLKDSVKNWLLFRTQKAKTPEKKFERTKIFIPQSPTGSDDDTDLSLTLTPCTPSSQTTHSRNSEPGTPKLSIERSSPSISNARSKKRILMSSQANTIKLGKSLLGSQEKSNNSCDLTGVSMNNTFGFNLSVKNLQNARALLEHHFLTVLIMEIHVRTRGDLKPNPEYDNTCAIFYSILNDFPENDKKALKSRGAIVLNTLPLKPESMMPLLDGIIDCDITYVNTETELIDRFLELIQYWDPDILAGYEIEMLSWGYLIDRASILGYNLIPLLGRIKESNDKYIRDGPQGELKITGRITLDVWRLMRHEISLQSYTFESIAYHILHKRVPSYTFKKLTFWWDHLSHLYRHRTVHHYLFRVDQILELFDKLDLVGRTSELARLFGIQFYEVLSRGSQFRVESMMLRLAKPLNFIPVSPSVQQRAKMKAPEYTPLVLEPESKLYVDPVVVLDFQSLYPSIMIAYNYCFSTCIGKVERLGKNTPFEFGATQLKISKKRVEKLVKADMINFSPCGVGFVKSKIREGIVPRMLKEILETRLMVKNSMKQNKEDAVLKRVLHNRQLGLKLIANVTYGYTSANFSGRMPAIEVGDSVVSKGRETLQRAIALVDNTPEWGAKVVYGDTDSLFILFPGRSKEWAFDVGKKIADVVTEDNPDPVKLKFEKVYQPCILQTKKRYVGYMYESPDQKEPIYEAKGIETVRRDGCPAVSKMLEKCLRLVFETKDVSIIKKYILRQFNKIIAGRISIQDFTFAKEYRGASSYRPGACVPSLELARKWKAEDKRSEPRRGERVPYVIVNGPPGLPIIKLVRSPRELLADPSLRPNALYYITRVIIPPINRCLTLIGADLHIWFNQMPRKHIQVLPTSSPGKKSTISQYFSTTSCASCGEQTKTGLCNDCCLNAQTTVVNLTQKIKKWEQNNYEVNLICQSCTKSVVDISCASLDCPIYYRRVQTGRDLQQSSFARQLLLSEF